MRSHCGGNVHLWHLNASKENVGNGEKNKREKKEERPESSIWLEDGGQDQESEGAANAERNECEHADACKKSRKIEKKHAQKVARTQKLTLGWGGIVIRGGQHPSRIKEQLIKIVSVWSSLHVYSAYVGMDCESKKQTRWRIDSSLRGSE